MEQARIPPELNAVFSHHPGFCVILLDAELGTPSCAGPELTDLGLGESNRDWPARLSEQTQKTLRRTVLKTLKDGPQDLKLEVGTQFYSVWLTPLADSTDLIVSAWHNVTVRTNQAALQELMDGPTPVGAWELSCLTQQITWSAETHQIFNTGTVVEGSEPEAPTLPEWLMSFQGRSRNDFEDAIMRGIMEGASFDLELDCLGTSRSRTTIRIAARPIWQAGAVARLVGSCQDVTEQRLVKEKARTEDGRAQALLAAFPDAYLVLDFEAMIKEVHLPEGHSPPGLPSDCVGRNLKVVLPNLVQYFAHQVQTAVHGSPGRPFEFTVASPDGKELRFEARTVIFDGGGGRPARYALFLRDLTSAWERELELIHAREVAVGASKIKSQFLATMSHEIRTPLNGVLGMTELVLNTDLNQEQRECLGAALQSGRSLLQIVDDILDLSKIEADRLNLELIPFSVRNVARECLNGVAVRAHNKGLELVGRVESEIPPLVMGDPVRFKQILNNLLSNAVKFTDRGDVELEILQREPDWIRVNVFDSGVGIPPEQQGHIFEAFIQADGTTTRRFGGTGLGLAICKQLVEKMEGQIWLESQPGQGSRFSLVVRLPRYQGTQEPGTIGNLKRDLGAKAETLDPERFEKLKGMRALIVDDNPICRRVLKTVFGTWEIQATAVPDGDTALARIGEASKRDLPFQAIVIEDRPENSAVINYTEPGLIKILLVALGRSPCAEVGKAHLTALLTKPVLSTDIAEVLVGLETGVHPPEEKPPEVKPDILSAPTPQVESNGTTILLAEDNMTNAKVVSRILERLGYGVVHVENGQLALDELERTPYEVVLMDVQMPVLDGLEATRRWRQREAAKGGHVTVIALTANAMMGDRERCLEHGMDFYLTKPIQRDRLVEVLNEVRTH